MLFPIQSGQGGTGYTSMQSDGVDSRYWYVIKDSYLYCYLTSEDRITVDITHLHGYEVTSLIDQFREKRFVVSLSHENYIPIYLALESRDEMDTWSRALDQAAQLPDEHCEEEEVEAEGTATSNKTDHATNLMTVKQKLLAEVLRQKEELEKKQAARRMACQNEAGDVQRRAGGHLLSSSNDGADVHVSTVTRLKQRRMSTQIKMEAIQRQLGEGIRNGQKKSLFKIGKKKSQEDKNPQLVDQLKELSTTLQEIDINLNSEGVLTKNNIMSSTVGFEKIPTDVIQKGDSFEDEQAVYRSNSLKASVQRLAHRTFAKAGWRKNTKKSQSLHFDEYHPDDPQCSPNQEMIDLTTHSADIISTISFSSCAELMSATSSTDLQGQGHHHPSSPGSGSSTPGSACNPGSPCSPGVVNFPVSPMCPNSSPRERGLAAARAEMMTRSYSAGAGLSASSCETEPSSPRREVNPSIMAEIDAFEELTKQVLSQKSVLASH